MFLFLSSVFIVVTDNMDSTEMKEFECVEFTDVEQKDQNQEKSPRQVIRFSSGEIMEEYSTEEEVEEAKEENKDLLSSVDTTRLQWGPYVHFHMWRAATSTLSACDFVGEKMASLFGITTGTDQDVNDEQSITQMKKEDAEDVCVSQDVQSQVVEPWNKKSQAEESQSTEEKIKENLNEEIPVNKNHVEEKQVEKNQVEKNQVEKKQVDKNHLEEYQVEMNHVEENRKEKNLTEENHVEESDVEKNPTEENHEQQMFQPDLTDESA